MKNLIRSKEEQIRKQEAEIARKTHEIQSSPRRDPYILKATACTKSHLRAAICSGGSRGGARASRALSGVKKEELTKGKKSAEQVNESRAPSLAQSLDPPLICIRAQIQFMNEYCT